MLGASTSKTAETAFLGTQHHQVQRQRKTAPADRAGKRDTAIQTTFTQFAKKMNQRREHRNMTVRDNATYGTNHKHASLMQQLLERFPHKFSAHMVSGGEVHGKQHMTKTFVC